MQSTYTYTTCRITPYLVIVSMVLDRSDLRVIFQRTLHTFVVRLLTGMGNWALNGAMSSLIAKVFGRFQHRSLISKLPVLACPLNSATGLPHFYTKAALESFPTVRSPIFSRLTLEYPKARSCRPHCFYWIFMTCWPLAIFIVVSTILASQRAR